jgi:hypothetical protein
MLVDLTIAMKLDLVGFPALDPGPEEGAGRTAEADYGGAGDDSGISLIPAGEYQRNRDEVMALAMPRVPPRCLRGSRGTLEARSMADSRPTRVWGAIKL